MTSIIDIPVMRTSPKLGDKLLIPEIRRGWRKNKQDYLGNLFANHYYTLSSPQQQQQSNNKKNEYNHTHTLDVSQLPLVQDE
jgi:hypothetical protein